MARKSERRKGTERRADRDSKRVAAPKAAKAAKAVAPPPPPAKIKFRGKLLENEPLARHITWRIGGPARYLAMPADSEDVVRALELAQDRGLPRRGIRRDRHGSDADGSQGQGQTAVAQADLLQVSLEQHRGHCPRSEAGPGRRVTRQADRHHAGARVQDHRQLKYFAHESSYVDDGATIGNGTKIWHFSHVMPGAVIGERCNLGQNVVVMPGTKIGNNVKIQ